MDMDLVMMQLMETSNVNISDEFIFSDILQGKNTVGLDQS